jgi:hypothetical protein
VWNQEINVQEPQQRFKANTRVRLREGVDPGFYNGFSRVGNEGWVRKRKLDKYGYPQVLVEWDKDHWAYNGQPDGWTWEGHFEIAEDANMSETPDKNQRDEALQTLAETFVKGVVSIIDGGEGPAKSEPVPSEGAVEEHWTEAAREAANAVLNSPAYIVIALDERQSEGEDGPTIVVPYIMVNARDEKLRMIAQSQLGHLLATLQDRALESVLKQDTDG